MEKHFDEGIITWLPNLMETQVDLIATTLTSLTSPLLTLLNPNPHPKPGPVEPAMRPSSAASDAANRMIRRAGQGMLAAAYTGMVLTTVMAVAAVMGILLVNCWAEEPVFVRQKLFFDYTDVNPEAVVILRRLSAGGGGERMGNAAKGAVDGVPVGHSCHVSVSLLVPDSDYNRDIGVFQLMAEVVSTNGRIIARSSQPLMLQFRSHPIRLLRTLLMGLPVLFGFTRETQKINVQMLKYKEAAHNLSRTDAIKITLMPRAGTPYLPQLYEAELLMHSKLPRLKEFVHNWRWTLYVWVSMYIYITLLLLLVCFFKPLLAFPGPSVGVRREEVVLQREERQLRVRRPEDREFTEALRKWQQYRKKRKAELFNAPRSFMEDASSTSASSYTVTSKEDIGHAMEEEDVGDSASVCLGG